MILRKTKKIFLLALLVMVSFVLNAVKFITGSGKTSQAQAQCWTPPSVSASSTSGCSGGFPDACTSSSVGCSSTGCSSTGCSGCGGGCSG